MIVIVKDFRRMADFLFMIMGTGAVGVTAPPTNRRRDMNVLPSPRARRRASASPRLKLATPPGEEIAEPRLPEVEVPHGHRTHVAGAGDGEAKLCRARVLRRCVRADVGAPEAGLQIARVD